MPTISEILSAELGQKQEYIETGHQEPVLREEIHVYGRDDHKQQNADGSSGDLNNHLAQAAAVIVGAGNHHHAEGGNGKAEGQQHQIALAQEAFKFRQELAHCIASFSGPL